jgi:flagellar basal-body rod protein FlgB
MLVNEIVNSGALPSLEMTIRFAGARQRVIAHNIANLNTPDFRPTDASPAQFQKALKEAVDRRREATGGSQGELDFRSTRQVKREADGSLSLTPTTSSGNILFPDRNNRDVERLMQANVENAGVFRVAVDLMKNRFDEIRTAIAERA